MNSTAPKQKPEIDSFQTCLGLDIAKAKLDACLFFESRFHHAQFENSKAGIKRLRAWHQKLGAPLPFVVLESTGRYGDLAALELHTAGHQVHLANPRRIKDYARSYGRRNKTDRVDAQLIADFGAKRQLPVWEPPSAGQQRLRDLLRRLADLENLLQAERNRSEAISDSLIAKSLARVQCALEREVAAIEKQIAAHLKANPDLDAEVQLLCQIEGIGIRSARWICAEVPRYLPNGRAAAAWLAVTPRLQLSGTSLRGTAPAGADGNRHLRKVLFMAALVARHRNPRLKTFADRLADAGKSKMAVIIAVLHKLVKITFSILKSGIPYDRHHVPVSAPKKDQNKDGI
jgi:transposase